MGLIFYALKKGSIEQQQQNILLNLKSIPIISIIIDKQECVVCFEEKENLVIFVIVIKKLVKNV